MKISKQLRLLVEEDTILADAVSNLQFRLEECGFEGISVLEVESDDEDGVTFVTFTDSVNELLVAFFEDEELGPVCTVVEDESELESEELDLIVLDEPKPSVDNNGLIDFEGDLTWLDADLLEELFSFGEMEERQITVIRGGKKVKKEIKRKIRKKRLSAKRKLAIRQAVKKRKLKKRQSDRKRKRSLMIRKRNKLKKRPKNTRVIG